MKDFNLLDPKKLYNNSIFLKKSASNNNFTDLYIKGLHYFYGVDCPINYKESFEIFNNINNESNQTNNAILLLLGIMYEKGLYVQQMYRKAVEYYKKAAKNGCAKAYYHLGLLAEQKILDEEDNINAYDDVAFDYYTKAANLGYSDALAKIGIIFEQGLLNTQNNQEEAFKMFENSVKIDNNPVGLNGEGNAFYRGIVKEKNFEMAVELYRRAIHGGNVDALNNLGLCYEYGLGVEQNNEKALELYEKGREKGHRDAQSNYAILKIKIGIKNNNYSCFSECFKILQNCTLISKNKGEIYYYLRLMCEIGIDFFNDGNNIRNHYMAFLHYKKAAEFNYSKAYTKLGICLFNGIENILMSNVEASIKMLENGVKYGDSEAQKYLDYIKKNIKE